MKFIAFQRSMPAWAAIAVSASTCLSVNPASAQTKDQSLPSIIVSGSRFASDPANMPIGATVITADQIREAGVASVNDAIRKVGGVYGRANSSGSSDYDLDLRGFGATSSQNMVVLVDGVRLSENEQTWPLLSSIPIESVDRIEIVRGGSSVLYGEGATGGTIQIITKRGGTDKLKGTVFTALGSFDHRELRASAAKAWEGFSLDAHVGTLHSDNYRANNEIRQNNFSGGMQWGSNQGRIGLRVDASRQDSRFAGPLDFSQFKINPRQASTPDDFGSYDTNRYTIFVERQLGSLDVAAELSHRERKTTGHFVFNGGLSDSNSESTTTQFSPRIRHTSKSGKWGNELVAGLDFTDWDRSFKRADFSTFSGATAYTADVSQKSKAIYVRDEISFDKARIALGGRHEKIDKDATGANAYSKDHTLNAWELQGNYELNAGINVFAKAGRSYRVANADENASTPVFNQPLKPQTSRDLELGSSIKNEQGKISAKVFRHKLRNEIFFNPAIFRNSNLDPTKREGIELEGNVRLASEFLVSANFQHLNAKFLSGVNKGNEVVLVPKNIFAVRLNWFPANGHSADIGVQWTDSQRYGGDFDNACKVKIPSFTTVDGRYAVKVGAWEFAIIGTNLTDKDYFTNAFGPYFSGGECQVGIYPDPGRQIKISARMDF